MKFDIETTAKLFKQNPHNPQLQNDVTNYIISKFKSFIYKYSYTYKTFDNSDVDSIITDVFIRIQKNIEKWDETLCQFKTWLYSCVQNEIRAYFTTKEKFYTRFITETKLNSNNESEESENNDINKNSVFTNMVADDNREKDKMRVIKSGTLERIISNPPINTKMVWVLYDEDNNIVDKQKYIRIHKKINCIEILDKIKTIDDYLILRNGRSVPHRKYNVNYVVIVDGYHTENDDFELARVAVKSIIETKLDNNQKKFMTDYFSGEYSYINLVDKYDIPMPSVKNWIHNNKKIIKENLKLLNLTNEKMFASI